MAESTSSDQSYEKVESPVKIKKEKPDVSETTNYGEVNNFIVNSPELSQLQARDVTITVALNNASGANDCKSSLHNSTAEMQSKQKETATVPAKQEPPPIDSASIRGAFGWTTIGEVHLPFLLRGEDRFIAVHIVESQILSAYMDILPWSVFACTNIRSYFITDNEAKLLNEINTFHCDYFYGYQIFSTDDVVVRLSDTVKFYEFLETCRTKLHPDNGNPLFKEQCGFVIVNFKAIPYVRKGKKKYILYNMVYQEGVSAPVSCTETVSEWDMSYFRFLSSLTTVDQRYLKVGASLCSLDDLQPALGMVELEEWWPSTQHSSKNGRPMLPSSECMMPKYGDSLPFVQPDFSEKDSSGKLRDMKELQAKNVMSPFPDIDWLSAKSSDVNRHSSSDSRAHLFPSSLEGLLATSQPPINYQLQYASQMQSSVMPNITQHLGSESGLSSLATSRPRPFPPPPPLVRLEQSPRSTTVPIIDHRTFSKTASSSLYPYMHPGVTPGSCSPWIAGMLEPEWFQKNERRATMAHQTSELANAPQSQSRVLSGDDQWTVVSSGVPVSSSTGSSSYSRNYNINRGLRESYDPTLCRDDRLTSFQRGSPRPATGAGPPPHYPTPPQSSPLQSLSLLECPPLPGHTDIYGMRATPLDLCSPPPSPEIRTSLPTSPRGNYGVSTSYQPHTVRAAQLDTLYMLAINVEPHKHDSILAVPVSEVVTKFLRGISVESCQAALESRFGLQLYDCTSLHQEAYAKHNVPVVAGSKMVSIADLRNNFIQLKYVLAEQELQKERNYDFRGTEDDQPLSKRWHGKD